MGHCCSKKRQPIVVAGETFKTKKSLRERIRWIRGAYPDNVRLNDADFVFMRDLLNRHEHRAVKIGAGVSWMYVKTNEVYKTNRGFWLVRVDGSHTDFSFEKCLRSETKLQQFKAACRGVVANTVQQFKLAYFRAHGEPAHCAITGELMWLRENSHVDHTKPNTFDAIVTKFLSSQRINVDDVKLLVAEDGQVVNEIADKQLVDQFLKFHNKHAVLRVISKRANLSVVKSETGKITADTAV